MGKLYRPLDDDLCYCAVDSCYSGKFTRNDILTDIEEWTGYSRREIWENMHEHGGSISHGLKYEIQSSRAMAVYDMIDAITHGEDPDFDQVKTELRKDGCTGKERKISTLCIRHQLLGHAIKLGLQPLFDARL